MARGFHRRRTGVAARSVLSLSLISAVLACAPGPARAADPADTAPALTWLTADGAVLVDEAGHPFIPRSVNWYGFESQLVPGGLWARPYRSVTVDGVEQEGLLDQVKRLGFNSIRLPICEDVAWPGHPIAPGAFIDPVLNPDLATPTEDGAPVPIASLAILDKVVAHAASLGLRVFLDMHCLAPNPDNVAGTGGRWYTTPTPGAPGAFDGAVGEPRSERQWLAAWRFLADRYKDTPAVAGFDLVNEPHRATWDDDPQSGWPAAAERAIAAIRDVNPRALVIVEGIAGPVNHGGGRVFGTIWASNLSGVANRPVQDRVPGKLVYSPHEYGSYGPGTPSFAHEWFNEPDFPGNLSNIWRAQWGFIAEIGLAPVWIGEVGSHLRVDHARGPPYTQAFLDADAAWLTALNGYMRAHGIGFAWWALNPAGEPTGLLSAGENGRYGEALDYMMAHIAVLLAKP